MRCTDCKGEGKILLLVSTVTCKLCNGTGEIITEKEHQREMEYTDNDDISLSSWADSD